MNAQASWQTSPSSQGTSHKLQFRDWRAVADGGIDMTDLQGVIGLLYRAGWTGLSLAADVRSETDQDLLRSRVRAAKPSWVPEGRGRSSRGVYPEGGPPTWADATSEEPGGYHSWHARLLIAPGGRYRQEYLDEPIRGWHMLILNYCGLCLGNLRSGVSADL